MFKAIFLKQIMNGNKRAEKIEEIINEKTREGWRFVSFSHTPNLATTIIFEIPENL